MKTLLVAILMIASVVTIFQITETVEAAADTNWGWNDITGGLGNITISAGTGGTWRNGFGSGQLNISWDSDLSFLNTTGVGADETITYNVTFSPDESATGDHIVGTGAWDIDGAGNHSMGFGTNTYFLWNTTTKGQGTTHPGIADGIWWVNVTGGYFNKTSNTHFYDNSSTGPVRINVSNTMPDGTPGVEDFQGGNYDTCGFGGNPLATAKIDYKVGTEYTLLANSAMFSGKGSNYYLYYPVYNGSDDMANSQYDLDWERYNTDFVTDGDYSFGPVTFDRAGLWVIDNILDRQSDADFSTVTKYNSTVAAWLWVNTSKDYTMNDIEDDFIYNATGYIPISITDENGETPAADGHYTVVDIRRDDNGSSIFGWNRKTTSWEFGTSDTAFFRNNSYNGGAFPGQYGFWEVGNYSVHAYRDTDSVGSGDHGKVTYQEQNFGNNVGGWKHYNETYGAGPTKNCSDDWLLGVSKYNWYMCGPWDPPEHNVTLQYIRVKTGEPYTAITENSTVYYGFDGTINISLAEINGGSAIDQDQVMVAILDDDDINVTGNFSIFESTSGDGAGTQRTTAGSGTSNGGRITIKKTGGKAGWVLVNMTKWGRNDTGDMHPFADNGTWEITIWADMGTDRPLNGDGTNRQWTEEWNSTTSLTFKVKSGPTAQWKWVDDDGNVSAENTDEIIPYVPAPAALPVRVQFKIFDTAGNTFGDLLSGKSLFVKYCAENITITGNSLFTGALTSFPGYADSLYSAGIWTVPIIPTMSIGGGSITIRVTAYNTSISKTITVGTANYQLNGSVATVTPNEFDIDSTNQTLTIEVQFADSGDPMQTVQCNLYYIADESVSDTGPYILNSHMVAETGTYSGGTYSILFNTTMQTTNQTTAGLADGVMAPRNLTVYVDGTGTRDGYALIQMKPVSDLEVHLTHETFMSGQEYDDVTLSCDFVNGTEGKSDTDTPSTLTAEKAKFHMKIFDKDHNDVTGTVASLANNNGKLYGIYDSKLTGDDSYSFSFDDVYGLDAGTYTVYAYNNTHNSEGHNATFEIKPVEITCDMAPFIWMSDKNISATFTMTYDGNPVNGSLTLDNMSDVGAYNKTWVNGNWDGTGSPGTNSLEVDDTYITNGVYTIDDITPDALNEGRPYQNITLWFKPTTDGQWARAKDKILVEVPTVTPDPAYIPLGRTTKVYCTATGRGETLNDVWIGLVGQGFNGSSTTDVDGRVTFSITPATTGNISIDVGMWNRTLEDTVIQVVAWTIDASTDAEVNELEEFTVTVIKEGTTDVVVGATVAITGIGTDTTDANGQATFTAPEITSDRAYTIKITKEGYAPDPDGLTITVINIPKLIVVIPDEVQATTTFDVAIADDTGGAIVGAIITFNEKTYTTGVGGVATITAPKTEGSYPIEVTFGNYEEATAIVTVTKAPGIPGFELLSLIAALGVAFIIFRRRRR